MVFFHFHSNFKRNFCKQTVKNLIRHRVSRRLIWFCTVCLCPTKRTLGLYRLNTHYHVPVAAKTSVICTELIAVAFIVHEFQACLVSDSK